MKLQLIMQPHLFARLVYRTTPSLQELAASLARLFADYHGPSAAKHPCVPSAYLSRPDVRLRRRYRANLLLRLAFSPLRVQRARKFTYLVLTTIPPASLLARSRARAERIERNEDFDGKKPSLSDCFTIINFVSSKQANCSV